MNKNTPDYKKIYSEMIPDKFPDKSESCRSILNKKELNTMDIITLNTIISRKDSKSYNQKLKSYDRHTIFEILDYQKKHQMTNVTAARHFNLSRNTLQKWKKIFQI